MGKTELLFLVAFIAALILQLALFEPIELFGFIPLYPYLLFLLVMPLGWRLEFQLFVAFLLGLGLDIGAASLGLHAGAATLLAFSRIPFIRKRSSQQRELPNSMLNPRGLSPKERWNYILILISAYSLSIFFMSAWPIYDPLRLILQCLLTILTNTLLLAIILRLFFPIPSK